MKIPSLALLLALTLSSVSSFCADKAIADGLAAAGAALAAEGKMPQAKEMLYKALANDENCADAIFELAKIFDKENSLVVAGDFYSRAALLMANEAKLTQVKKRQEAEARIKTLNPFALSFNGALDDYVHSLDTAVTKYKDTLTQEVASARVTDLKLSNFLAKDKMPKFALIEPETKKPEPKKSEDNGIASKFPFSRTPSTPVKTDPAVEKELKALGWTVVSGNIVKKGASRYVFTDAKLEAPKTNGIIDFWMLKEGFSGTLSATVRSDFGSSDSFYSKKGYGFECSEKVYRVYAPIDGFFSSRGNSYEPSMAGGSTPYSEAPSQHFQINLADTVIEYYCNDKKLYRYSQPKMGKTGPFLIEINGTATLEMPRCAGQ